MKTVVYEMDELTQTNELYCSKPSRWVRVSIYTIFIVSVIGMTGLCILGL